MLFQLTIMLHTAAAKGKLRAYILRVTVKRKDLKAAATPF